jgi:ring-1,2-phenylacetyl-CoA epoxidase subunit PaaD
MVSAAGTTAERRVWDELARIPDPEIPAISVVDLGVIGSVAVEEDRVRV